MISFERSLTQKVCLKMTANSLYYLYTTINMILVVSSIGIVFILCFWFVFLLHIHIQNVHIFPLNVRKRRKASVRF